MAIEYKGLYSSGYVSWIGQYAEKDAALVEVLYEAGAVPFVKTNIPQTLMVSRLSLLLRRFAENLE